MYNKVLLRIQKKVKEGDFVISDHASFELLADGFDEKDIIKGILSGKILERQKDFHSDIWKYRIRGNSHKPNKRIEIVVKEVRSIIIITAYLT